jgi:hypothetical protein
MGAIVARLRERLDGSCLPRALNVEAQADGTMRVPCSVVEATPDPAVGCDIAGRGPVAPKAADAAYERLEALGRCGGDGPPCDASAWSLCEIQRSTADADSDGQSDCLQAEQPAADVGWCYVDPERGLGDEALVADCDPEERRILRFVDPDDATPASGATILTACLGADLQDDETLP